MITILLSMIDTDTLPDKHKVNLKNRREILDTMTDDSSLSQNRTTLLINHVTSLAARNILEQQTITSESLTTLTNLTMLNNNNNSTSETFTITNFHLNRSTTISNNQVHDIDMMDTTRNNIDTNQFNNKAHVVNEFFIKYDVFC
ncbi:unnamed protein product [Rotaria sp. Silwood1]|nr:unnamed protein product [Rotaria sp. Silwood1]